MITFAKNQIAVILFLFGALIQADAPRYNNPALNDLHCRFEQYVNMPTHEVVAKIDTDDDMAESFKKDFLITPVQEEITSRYFNQALMDEVNKLTKQQDASAVALDIQHFLLNGSLSLQNKENALQEEIDNLAWTQKKWLMFTVPGALCLVPALILAQDRRTQSVGMSVAGVGTIIIGTGIAGAISTSYQRDPLDKHIAQVKSMKNSWQNHRVGLKSKRQ